MCAMAVAIKEAEAVFADDGVQLMAARAMLLNTMRASSHLDERGAALQAACSLFVHEGIDTLQRVAAENVRAPSHCSRTVVASSRTVTLTRGLDEALSGHLLWVSTGLHTFARSD